MAAVLLRSVGRPDCRAIRPFCLRQLIQHALFDLLFCTAVSGSVSTRSVLRRRAGSVCGLDAGLRELAEQILVRLRRDGLARLRPSPSGPARPGVFSETEVETSLSRTFSLRLPAVRKSPIWVVLTAPLVGRACCCASTTVLMKKVSSLSIGEVISHSACSSLEDLPDAVDGRVADRVGDDLRLVGLSAEGPSRGPAPGPCRRRGWRCGRRRPRRRPAGGCTAGWSCPARPASRSGP